MPKFSYTRTTLLHSKTFQQFKNFPILKVGLLAPSGSWVKAEAYIDTGAQICLFDNSYAKQLSIKDYKQVKNDKDIIPLSGIGGTESSNIAYFHDLKLIIFKDERNLKLKNALHTIDTKIGFLQSPIHVAGILGVYGFLDHFSFTANIPEGYFEIKYLF